MNKVIMEFYLHFLLRERRKIGRWYIAVGILKLGKYNDFLKMLGKYGQNNN